MKSGNALADQTYKGVDTGYVGDTQQGPTDYSNPAPGTFGGFADEAQQNQHQAQMQQPPQQQQEEHDFMSNIPPPTSSDMQQQHQPDAPVSNQYGDFANHGDNNQV